MNKNKAIRYEDGYLLGCLLGRGTIIPDKSPAKYLVTIRAAHHKYSPIGNAVVSELVKSKEALTSADLVNKCAELHDFHPRYVGMVIARYLVGWHPPRQVVPNPMIVRENKAWKINDEELAHEYLEWQDRYKDREFKILNQFIFGHLRDTAHYLGNLRDVRAETGPFLIKYWGMVIEIPELEFGLLKERYGIEEGDVCRSLSLPWSLIQNTDQEVLKEVVRGVADMIATFNRGPTMDVDSKIRKGLISHDAKLLRLSKNFNKDKMAKFFDKHGIKINLNRISDFEYLLEKISNEFGLDEIEKRFHIWRVQFSVYHENRQLPILLCRILQESLGVPVNCIGWAEEEKGAYARGTRDHLVRVCLYDLWSNFGKRLFYNTWKQNDYEKYAKWDVLVVKLLYELIDGTPSEISFCPRYRKREPHYVPLCRKYGCPRVQLDTLKKWTNTLPK